MSYIIETIDGQQVECHSAPYSSEKIDELLGKVADEDVGGGVFWAEYGVTTFAEVIEAYEAGKMCAVNQNNELYYLCTISATLIKFTKAPINVTRFIGSEAFTAIAIDTITVNANNSWLFGYSYAESSDNRTSEITAESTNVKYPTAKAVVDYVAANPGVFWAEYGVTTSAEIEEAYQAGKEVLVEYHSFITRLDGRDSATSHQFASLAYPAVREVRTMRLQCNSDEWTSYLARAEDVSQRVKILNAESGTDNYYPTAKAVVDYVAANKQVFWATYGATTYAEIAEAYNAGKDCIVDYVNVLYRLSYVSDSYCTFSRAGVLANINNVISIAFQSLKVSANGWELLTSNGEAQTNKVQSISEEDTSNKYPSSLAVQAYVAANKDIFWAEYGVTPFAEILEAYNAGKICMVLHQTYPCILTRISSGGAGIAKFISPSGASAIVVTVLESNNSYQFTAYNLENTAFRVQDISTNDAPVHYPSSPAVQSYVGAQLEPVSEAADNAQTAAEAAQDTADTAEEYALGAYVTPTASGAVASLDDGAEDIPVKSLTVDIEPVQNLNGYDAPWPPGGGSNLLGYTDKTATVSGVTASCVNGVISFSGTNTNTAAHGLMQWRPGSGLSLPDFSAGERYVIKSSLPSGLYAQFTYINTEGSAVGLGYVSNLQREAAFTIPDDFASLDSLFVGVNGEATTISGAGALWLNTGSTATDYEPYSNICPITGWTGANVQRTGKNLLDLTPETAVSSQKLTINPIDGGYEMTSTGSYGRIGYLVEGLEVGGTYTLSMLFSRSVSSGVSTSIYLNDNGNWDIGNGTSFYGSLGVVAETAVSRTITTTTGIIFVGFYVTSGEGSGDTIQVKNVQLELGDTATAYEPYQGESYDITFPDEAGTVYGGTLDVTTGLLTVDARVVQIKDLTLGSIAVGNRRVFRASGSNGYASSLNGPNICECFAYSTLAISEAPENSWLLSRYWDKNLRVAFYAPEYETTADFKAAFGEYSLAIAQDPVTYQLTPTEVTTLLGVNNIYADTGDTSVTYRADPTLIYNKLTAAINTIIGGS